MSSPAMTKGKTGEVVKAMPSEGKVVVQGVNLVKRHTKPSQTTPGGIITKEAPINVSNVASLTLNRQGQQNWLQRRKRKKKSVSLVNPVK